MTTGTPSTRPTTFWTWRAMREQYDISWREGLMAAGMFWCEREGLIETTVRQDGEEGWLSTAKGDALMKAAVDAKDDVVLLAMWREIDRLQKEGVEEGSQWQSALPIVILQLWKDDKLERVIERYG